VTRLPRREGLAVLSGVLLALSFPKFGHGVVAWVALAPLLVALAGAGAFQAFRLGYLTGAVSSLGLLYWTALVVIQYGGLSLPVGIGVMTLLCLAVALFPSLFAFVVSRWLAALGPGALVLAPFAWVATELLRRHTFFDFPWCLLGYSQHDHLAFIQIASVTAVYGVSFLVAACSALLAYAAVEPRHRGRAAIALLGLLGAAWGYGTWVLSRPLPEAGRIRVGLVQAGILQEEKWEPEGAWTNVSRHLDLTRRAAERGARLVVWPESAVPFYFDRSPGLAGLLERTVRDGRIFLIFGNDDRQDLPDGTYRAWVGAKMLTPEGEVALRYHKMKLVPFGEYVPLHPLLTLGGRVAAKMVQQVSDFTPGTDPVVAALDGHRLGVFICYEAIFPDLVREFTTRGADLLVNITNDAWYGRTSAPYQHLAMAAFRAVENGKYLVRAANTGITAVVDPRGRVLEPTTLFERAVLVRDVPFVPGGTFYSRHGDVFAWGCLGAALALTAGTLRRRS
jgi:apolipoprotein N-acyltransferase